MSFQLDTNGIPTLRSYSEALTYWSNAHQWKNQGGEHDPRALAKGYPRKHHVSIRKLNDGSIACQFHSTDVVTYHPDDSIELESYPSISTNNFANALLPSGIRSMFNCSPSVLWIGWSPPYNWRADNMRGYRIANHLTIKRDEGTGEWVPVRLSDSFELYQLDAKRARAALKARGYHDFKVAVRMGLALNHIPDQDRSGLASVWLLRRNIFGSDERRDLETDYLALLADQSRWPSMIKHCHSLEIADTFFGEMRDMIYNTDACVSMTELAYVTSYKQFQMVTRAMKYGNAKLYEENRL